MPYNVCLSSPFLLSDFHLSVASHPCSDSAVIAVLKNHCEPHHRTLVLNKTANIIFRETPSGDLKLIVWCQAKVVEQDSEMNSLNRGSLWALGLWDTQLQLCWAVATKFHLSCGYVLSTVNPKSCYLSKAAEHSAGEYRFLFRSGVWNDLRVKQVVSLKSRSFLVNAWQMDP